MSECSVRKCCSWAAIPICDSRYWCRCLVKVWNCVHVDISSGSRIGKRARLGNARGDPSLWRADATSASPMQLRRAGATSIAGKDFLPAIALEEPVVGQGPWAFCKWRDDGIVPLICPTCQNVFAGIAQSYPCQRPPCYFAWGCFRYFGWKPEPRRPLRLSFPLMIAAWLAKP